MITTALVIILGLTNGTPAQTIHREWPAREFVWAGAQAECDAARWSEPKLDPVVTERLGEIVERSKE